MKEELKHKYTAFDGTEFESAQDCEKHEHEKRNELLRLKDFDPPFRANDNEYLIFSPKNETEMILGLSYFQKEYGFDDDPYKFKYKDGIRFIIETTVCKDNAWLWNEEMIEKMYALEKRLESEV